jgi:hypothetical protein
MTWNEKKKQVLTKKGVENKAPKHHEAAMKDEYSTTLRAPLFSPNPKTKDENEGLAEEIVEEVQENRTESAKAKDESKTAKKVGSKEDVEDLVEWIREPGESDLEGVDTKKSKEYEDEEEQ